MFIRVDPSRSAGDDFFIMDADSSLTSLQQRDVLPCIAGGHQKLVTPILNTTQDITCAETGKPLYTIIYSTTP